VISRFDNRLAFSLLRLILIALAIAIATHASAASAVLPTDGNIVAGSGSISQTASSMTITQTTAKMAANWQTFNIGVGNSVNFVQPSASSVAINQVLGSDVSVIQGNLTANGQVFLVNPNGVLFTPTAQVNIGGLVASTLNLSTTDFMAGNFNFAGDSSNAIINQGNITAINGGSIALIAAKITNSGTLTANAGNVLLSAGAQVTLDLGGPVKLKVTRSAIDALIQNGGAIRADGGLVYLTAQAAGDLVTTVINNTGVIEARTLATGESGQIMLMGGMDYDPSPEGKNTIIANNRIVADGTLDASAPNGGDGGFIETSAANVKIADDVKVTTAAVTGGKTGIWLIDPHDYTIAATAGDITGLALTAALVTNNVTILSSQGANALGSGNINVSDAVTWSANKLTLTAAKDVNINAVMSAIGSSSLALNTSSTASGETATANGKVNIALGRNGFTGRIDFPNRTGTGMLNINSIDYTVIQGLGAVGSMTGLDISGMRKNLTGNYALGGNVDAAGVTDYVPVGVEGTTAFVGVFDGLGHVVSNLMVNTGAVRDASLMGSVGTVASPGTLKNIGVVSATISGGSYVGALAGWVTGDVSNSYSSGTVTGTNTYVGGLVGWITGNVDHSFANATVSAGLVDAGGLIGWITGDVSNSFATGNVSTGTTWAGGLLGRAMAGNISNSYATGNVHAGSSYAGGLVSANTGTITNSYATGNVSASESYSGGLTATSTGTVTNSYASGTVNAGTTFAAMFSPAVTDTVTNSYYNSDSVAGSATTSVASNIGGIGKTTAELELSTTFIDWDFTNTWYMPTNNFPVLRAWMTPLTVTVNNVNQAYNGSTYNLSNSDLTYSVTPDSSLLGALTNTGTSLGVKNVGSYTTASSYADTIDYIMTYVDGTLAITPKPLTATVVAASKTYDGNDIAANTLSITDGLVGDEVVGVSVGATFNTKDVLTANEVTVNSTTLTNGANGGLASNYSLGTGQTGASSITTKSLTATVTAGSRAYDGTTSAANTLTIDSTGFVGTETVTATGVATFNDKDVLDANLVTVNSTVLVDGVNDGLASNYSLGAVQAVTSSITKKALTATVTAASRVYDGTKTAANTITITDGLAGDEVVGVSADATFNTKDVLTANEVTVNSTTLTNGNGTNGGLASNYSLGTGQTAASSITTKSLTATVTAGSRAYDGTTSAANTLTIDSTGFVGTETVTATGVATFNDKDVLDANLVTVDSTVLADGLNDGLGSNYSLASGATTASTITTKGLAIVGMAAASKVYDGNLVAILVGGSLDTGVAGEALTFTGQTGRFADGNVANGIAVTVTNTALGNDTGGLASNYSLPQPTGLTADITAALDTTTVNNTVLTTAQLNAIAQTQKSHLANANFILPPQSLALFSNKNGAPSIFAFVKRLDQKAGSDANARDSVSSDDAQSIRMAMPGTVLVEAGGVRYRK
jgi:filamentous hemagglutinin family protein